MLSNCADIVPVTPELATPQLLFDAWHTRKDFAGRQALDYLHDLGRTIARHQLYETVDMISIRPDFEKDQFITLGDVQAHRFQHLIHVFTEADASVFGRAYDRVSPDGYMMTFSYQVAHASYMIGRFCRRPTNTAQQAAGNLTRYVLKTSLAVSMLPLAMQKERECGWIARAFLVNAQVCPTLTKPGM